MQETLQASDLDPAILFFALSPIWVVYFANGGDERDQFAELELDEDAVIQAIVQAATPASQYLLDVGNLLKLKRFQ